MRIVSILAAGGMAALLGLGTAEAGPMNAAPLATVDPPAPLTAQHAVQDGPTPKLELVRGGCGIGFHRGIYGRCRPNLWRRWGWRPWGWGGWGWHRWGWGWHRWGGGWGWHRWGWRRW